MEDFVYEKIVSNCHRAVAEQLEIASLFDENDSKWLLEHGVSWDTILSIFSQVYQTHVRKNSVTKYIQEYKRGVPIVEIASRVNYSPYFMARIIAEALLDLPKKQVSLIAKDTSLIPDERLRAEFEHCIEVDNNCSPHFDRLRHSVGAACERYLESRLNHFNIPFESEDELRQQGQAKTPDIHLLVPIGVKGPNSRFHVVHWIDSKGMFGDHNSHASKNMEQLQGYVNRFGPGMVIYWTGYLASLNTDPNILLAEGFPDDHISLTNCFSRNGQVNS